MFKGDEEAFCTAERGSIDTQTAAPSPFILNLPAIDLDVPMCYAQAAHPSIILLARQLSNIGVLTKDDTGKGRRRIDEAVKRVFSREISSILGELHLLTVSIEIGDGLPRDFFEPTSEHEATVMERFEFAVCFYNLPFLVIGKVLAELEQIRKGLGETVFAALSKAGSDNFGIFSFDSVLEDRGWMYYLDEREWDRATPINNTRQTTPASAMKTTCFVGPKSISFPPMFTFQVGSSASQLHSWRLLKHG